MRLFLSQYTNKIDIKGRVSVPVDYRGGLKTKFFNGVVAFRSYKFKTIEALDYERMKKIADSIDDLDFFSQNKNDLATTILSDSYKLPFDSEGRIHLPSDLLKFAGISNFATFVGRGSTFQIWDPKIFKNYLNKTRENIKKKKLSLIIKDINKNEKN
jgi:MraZ protein